MAHSPRVLFTRPIPDVGIDALRAAGFEVSIEQKDEEQGVTKEQLLARVRAADVLGSHLTDPVDRDVLAANPRLRGVANYAVGFNNIDIAAATALGIPVSNTPGVLTETTADLAWALMLAVARRIVPADEYMRSGRFKLWGPTLFLGGDIGTGASGRRKVLGIIGYGRIGSAVARRAIGFDMDVLAYDPHNAETIAHDAADPARHVRAASLDELLRESDFVSLHTLLSPETHHLIGERELGLMKRTAYLINTARGPVVDEGAVVRALQSHRIAGAAFDVYEHEPRMAAGLAELDNVVLAPHIASASHDTRDRMAVMTAENMIAHERGERAPNVVNPDVYDTPAYRARRDTATG